jgi:hypothetical protein
MFQKKIRKKYVDIANVVLCHCVNFQYKIRYILGSVKMTNLTKRSNQIFSLLFMDSKILIFFISLKYNIFRSENLHTYRIQYYPRHDIFFKKIDVQI